MMQIKTLSELARVFAQEVIHGQPLPCLMSRLGSQLRHDLHAFGVDAQTIEEEPQRTGIVFLDVWLAGAAEYLAQQHGLSIPAWCLAKWRFLDQPLFISSGERAKSLALVETPSAFRRRNLFCGRSSL